MTGRPISHFSGCSKTVAAILGSVRRCPISHLSYIHPTALPRSVRIWSRPVTITAARGLCRHLHVSDGPPNFSPYGARKTAAIIGSVSCCPISRLPHMYPIYSARGRPIPHLYRPIPSLLPARNLTRLRPISHATRPFPHFWARKSLTIKADLPPESESELNRTLEGKSRSEAGCGYVDNVPFHVSLTLDTADAKPLTRFATPIYPHPSLAHSRSLRRTYKWTIGISRLQQGLKISRSGLADKLESETTATPAGDLLGEASKRIFRANLTGFGTRRNSPRLRSGGRSSRQTHVGATRASQKNRRPWQA